MMSCEILQQLPCHLHIFVYAVAVSRHSCSICISKCKCTCNYNGIVWVPCQTRLHKQIIVQPACMAAEPVLKVGMHCSAHANVTWALTADPLYCLGELPIQHTQIK